MLIHWRLFYGRQPRGGSATSQLGVRKHWNKASPGKAARTKPYQIGTASWYGDYFQGKTTASGEPYDMYDLTAAHPTLPLGSWVRVTNLRNGRAVVVRINDRGPVVPGRIIDLSYNTARVLQFKSQGLAAGAPGRGAQDRKDPLRRPRSHNWSRLPCATSLPAPNPLNSP